VTIRATAFSRGTLKNLFLDERLLIATVNALYSSTVTAAEGIFQCHSLAGLPFVEL
jgi:hypothetical protein